MRTRNKAGRDQFWGAKSIAVTMLLMVFAAGCSAPPGAPGETPVQEQEETIATEAIAKHSMGSPREQIAEIEAAVDLDIVAQTSGKIVEITAPKGSSVQEGDVILRLESDSAQLSQESAQSSLQSAQEALTKAQKDLEASRMEYQTSISKLEQEYVELVQQGADTKDIENAQRELDTAKQKLQALESTSSLSSYKAQVESAKVTLDQAASSLDNYTITASSSGVITSLDAQVGEELTQGSQIGKIEMTDQVKIITQLNETQIALVGDKDELYYYSSGDKDQRKKATITYKADLPDSETRLYSVELTADNKDGALKPGSRVQVQLTTEEEENVLAVPTLSIVRDGNETFIFVVNNNQAEKREVELGRMNGSYQEVLSGVSEGEQVVTSGQHQLEDGQAITVEAPAEAK